MFQAIREYFRAKFSANRMHESKALVNLSHINFGIDNYPFKQYLPEDGYLTQAEQQLLKQILSETIQIHEEYRVNVLETAKFYKSSGNKELSQMHFKAHRQRKAIIKKLASLQKKIKHTLHTRG
jgi:hypothetical protein